MDGVNARLVDVAELALELSPIDFGIPELGGLRNADEQLLLFFNGKSQLDGTKKRSNHQSGKALDVFAYVDGKASWGAFGQTRTGTPQPARILSPLCLPISPRGLHEVFIKLLF